MTCHLDVHSSTCDIMQLTESSGLSYWQFVKLQTRGPPSGEAWEFSIHTMHGNPKKCRQSGAEGPR